MTPLTRSLHILIAITALLMAGCGQTSQSDIQPAGESNDASPSDSTATSSQPLDLTMDRDALFELDANGDQIDTSERADLPELVGPDASKRLTVNGGVITNEEAIGLRDRVDGAEVSFELKTD